MSVGAVPLAGCLGGGLESDHPNSPDDFEECPLLIIQRSDLPEPARREVDAALETGQYESDELYLPHVMDPDESYIEDDQEEYYQASVIKRESSSILELERTIPSHGMHALSIENGTDEQVSVDVRVEWLDEAEVVVESSLTIDPDGDAETDPFSRQFGDYWAALDTGDSGRTVEWTEKFLYRPLTHVSVTPNDRGLPPARVSISPEPCSNYWE